MRIPPSHSTLDTEPSPCYGPDMKIIADDIDWSVPLSRYQYVTDGSSYLQVIGMVAFNDGNPVYILRDQNGTDLNMSHAEVMAWTNPVIDLPPTLSSH